MVADLRSRPSASVVCGHIIYIIAKLAAVGFENLEIRGSGQIRAEVKSFLEVVDVTRRAWELLDGSVFRAAWMTCGYFTAEHFRQFEDVPALDLESARRLLEPYEGANGAPQRCVAFEWQIQATPHRGLLRKGILCYSTGTARFRPTVTHLPNMAICCRLVRAGTA